MPAPPEIIAHGQLPILMEDRMRRSLTGFDEGTLVYMADRRGYFAIGGNPPDYQNLIITEMDEDVDYGDMKISLRCRGLLDGASKVIRRGKQFQAHGWDSLSETVICALGTSYTYGAAHQSYGNLRLMDVGEEDQLDAAWAVRQLGYRGIESAGLTARRITVNENIVSPQDPIEVSLEGGWSPAAKGTVSLPRIVVVDTWKSTVAPDTDAIPGRLTPPSPPSIQTFAISGDLTKQWPNQWKLASMDPEELYLGAGLWLLTYNYEYVWPETF